MECFESLNSFLQLWFPSPIPFNTVPSQLAKAGDWAGEGGAWKEVGGRGVEGLP